MRAAKPRRITAYDLETTRIPDPDALKAGTVAATPTPLYITAFCADWSFASPIRDGEHLTRILETHFLTEDNLGVSFVAWNGNRFDAIIIAVCLLRNPDYILRPYLTRSKVLRGLKVIRAKDKDKGSRAKGWEFVDGIAMLGLPGVTLEKLVANFAPDFPKLTNAIDFEREEFDPENPTHCAYAMRDSEGLYWAMVNAQRILMETFGEPLSITMGAACIKIFTAHIPRDVVIAALPDDAQQIVHSFVMRGGYCYCVRKYRGPVWKYDLNQAYAAAMREARLPAGTVLHGEGKPPPRSVYMALVNASARRDPGVPFYVRTVDPGGRIRSVFEGRELRGVWLTSIEIAQLRREKWKIEFLEHYSWESSFTMREYVDKLERLRTTCEGGPSGPVGTMVKGVGNHSYGKTVEQIEALEYVLAAECPDDCVPYFPDDESTPIDHVFVRIDWDRRPQSYHQPHIGAWITAHVRMVVRRAALQAPDAWLYADTDCVMFSRDASALLEIDSKRYGAWKIEESGAEYLVIAKKVYTEIAQDSKPKRSAKGMNVRRLRDDDFVKWFNGTVPVQNQTQNQNFLVVMSGGEMYRPQTRKGTQV